MDQDQSTQDSHSFWHHHIQAQPESGLTQKAYCDKHTIKVHRFWYWKNKLNPKVKRRSSEGKPSTGFIPAQMTARSSTLTSGLTVSLPNGLQITDINANNLSLVQSLLSVLK
jgi:hypothetical protein